MSRKDIHIQPVVPSEVRGLKLMTFGFESALKVDGPQALVNRWTKTFVQPKGSDPLDFNAGTSFGQLLESNISSQTDIEDAVFLSVTDANDQVKQQDVEGQYPQNERLRDGILLGVVLDADDAHLEVYVKLTNVAGQTLTVRLATQGDR